MRTRKEISTISYNSKAYLDMVLTDLILHEEIEEYMYVLHKPEDDELKEHFHLFIKPNKQLDTMKLSKRFLENNQEDPLKPFGVISWRRSDYDEWLLYCMHHKAYLLSKGQSRKYHYEKTDFCFSDPMSFDYNWYHALKESDWACRNEIIKSLDQGLNVFDLLKNGSIPFSMSSQALSFDKLQMTYRNGRENHEKCQV